MKPSEQIRFFANGPFSGCIDPWAEDPFYFSQLHSGIIAAMLSQIWETLLERGYVASKEASLQIAELRKPDIALFAVSDKATSQKRLDYAAAASSILAEPGISADLGEPEYQAIFIRHGESGALVTVVEVISPRNKAYLPDILKYQDGQRYLFLEHGVNVVEIDLTRSVKRLLEHPLTAQYPYHIAIYIPGESPRIVPIEFLEGLKRCALPLLEDVIGVELQAAYEVAYREATVAPQLENNRHYTLEHLPFSSLLTGEQITQALEKIEAWRGELARLRDT